MIFNHFIVLINTKIGLFVHLQFQIFDFKKIIKIIKYKLYIIIVRSANNMQLVWIIFILFKKDNSIWQRI